MTPEELEELVRTGPTEALVAALAGMTEPERKKLSRAAADLRRTIRQDPDESSWSLSDVQVRAELAVCGLSSFTEVKTTRLLGENARWEHDESAARVLADRRPEWLSRLVEHDGKRRGVLMRNRFDFVRELVIRGAIERPSDDAYIESMVKAHAGQPWRTDHPLAAHLREHPDLLEHDVWRIFEIEPVESGSFEGYVTGNDPRTLWPRALAELAESGDLDRDRLIDAVLRAFRSAPGMQRARFLVRVHKELKPTKAECLARRSDYAEALGCAHANVVTEAAKALAKSKSPLADDVAPHVSVAIAHGQKATGRAVLKVLAMLGEEGAVLAVHGLTSPVPEIQSETLDLVETSVAPPAPAVADALRSVLESAGPSQQVRARELAAKLAGDDTQDDVVLSTTTPLDELRDQATACSYRDIAGLTACLDGRIEPVRFHPFDAGRLRSEVTPIASVEELALEWTRHAADGGDTARIERLLDATLRLCAERAGDFDRLVAPVRKTWVPPPDEWTPAPGLELAVAQSWCGRWDEEENPFFNTRSHPYLWFFGKRLGEIAGEIAARRPRQLLATPTHDAMWIDPRVFVQRLLATPRPLQADFVQALLRLAPDHRDEALVAAEDLPEPLRGWVRFALGGDEELSGLALPPAASPPPVAKPAQEESASFLGRLRGVARTVWNSKPTGGSEAEHAPFTPLLPRSALVAAVCRARDPWGSFDGGENEGGVDKRAEHVWEIVPMSMTAYDSAKSPGVDVRVEPGRKIDRPYVDHVLTPTAAFHRRMLQRKSYADDEPTLEPRLGAIWPADPSGWFRCGVRETVRRMDSPVSSYSPRSMRLEPFFDPDMPLTETAALLLVLALCTKDEDLRATARDATVTLVDDGRMDGALLGRIAARLVAGDVIKPGRLADSLAEIMGLSLTCASCTAEILGAAAVHCSTRSLIPVLTTLRDAYATLRTCPPDDLRATLESVPGKGKTAKLAKEVAAMSGPGRADELLAEAFESRIARALRYAELDWMPPR